MEEPMAALRRVDPVDARVAVVTVLAGLLLGSNQGVNPGALPLLHVDLEEDV
jgi:hypothetical protein